MKMRKRNCVFWIIFIAAICMTCGCAASPSAGYESAEAESEKYIEQTDVELSESSEESESLPTAEPLETEGSEETKSLPTAESLESAGSEEPESLSTAEILETESSEEVEYSSEEEIAALGIPEDMLAYWLVLNNKKPFISVNQEGQKFFWNEYFWYITWLCDEYSAYRFMIVDMDRDGREEIVLECDPGTTHILRYEDGEVYGYQFGVRSMLTISEDGIFNASGGVVNNYFLRLTELNKDGYTEELLAEQDGEHYEIGGKEVTWEEFYEYAENIFARQTERIDFTESMLKGHLLGDLSEQELALVKRIPAENMLESEPDYQEHKQALQLYDAVLKGEQDVILATEDTFKFADETLPIYFSLVDMDGDGVLELVFTCYFDVVWVLHYEAGEVYGYHLRDTDTLVITTDGVFRTDDDLSPTGYARIAAFEEDGFQIEPVENYKSGSHERIRYYYFSEEAIAKWLE